jgi:Na+-driven multidrug efflux pump
MRGYLTSADRSDLLRWAGLIGIAVRVPYTLICYYTPLGLMGFALGTSVDYLFRGMYYYLCSKRISKVQV